MDRGVAVRTVNELYKMCKAGERGFKTVAKNVGNRGLKVLLKTYAHQRRQFALDLKTAIEEMGGKVTEKRSVRGVIHRGRIDIIAALVIGPQNIENVVLKEAMVGERSVLNAYKRALSRELPAQVVPLIKEQYERIQETCEQVERLSGRPGDRLVVRLFDTDVGAAKASEALQNAGFSETSIEAVTLSQTTNFYEDSVKAVDEPMISGALGGAIWGTLLGVASGVGLLWLPSLDPIGAMTIPGSWALVTLIGTVLGALFGLILGFVIGLSTHEEDKHLYSKSIVEGKKLILLQTDRRHAYEASQIMHQYELSRNPVVS